VPQPTGLRPPPHAGPSAREATREITLANGNWTVSGGRQKGMQRSRRNIIRITLVALAVFAIIATGLGALLTSSDETTSTDSAGIARGAPATPAGPAAPESEKLEQPVTGQSAGDEARGADVVSGRGSLSVPITGPQVIRTASVELSARPKLVARAADRIVAITVAAGGSVASENRSGSESPSAEFVLSIPPDRLDGALTELAGVAKVRTSSRGADDVTGQVADVAGRVQAMEISVARLRAFLSEATDISQVVSLESELTRREADLESTRSQQQALESQVAMATVRVSLWSDPGGAAVTKPDPAPGPPSVADAFVAGWRAFSTGAQWIGVAVAASAPFVGLALLILGAVLLRRRAHNAQRPNAASTA